MTFKDIKYGWVALTSLVITGTTIFVLDNTRRQVKAVDIIEIVLGTHERCLATEYASNAFYVTPPEFIRTWTDEGGTNVIVTNAIGWQIDRDMMASLDTTIKALVPYYLDTNTVYDGSTNIQALTVTGLWAKLNIGDGTNKFTRTPAIGTNEPIYGDYPWQIYAEDLEERYKVLNALEMRFVNVGIISTGCVYRDSVSSGGRGENHPWVTAVSRANAFYDNVPNVGDHYEADSGGRAWHNYGLGAWTAWGNTMDFRTEATYGYSSHPAAPPRGYRALKTSGKLHLQVKPFFSQQLKIKTAKGSQFVTESLSGSWFSGYGYGPVDDNVLVTHEATIGDKWIHRYGQTNEWHEVDIDSEIIEVLIDYPEPVWCDPPSVDRTVNVKGASYFFPGASFYVEPQFSYATNRYW